MSKTRIDRALRHKVRVLAVKWAEAEKRSLDYVNSESENPRYSENKWNRLMDAASSAEDRMYKASRQLPLGARDDDDFGSIVAMMSSGIVSDYGFDTNSLHNWAEEVQDAMADEFLEKRGAWNV